MQEAALAGRRFGHLLDRVEKMSNRAWPRMWGQGVRRDPANRHPSRISSTHVPR